MLPASDVFTIINTHAGNNTGANITDAAIPALATITGPTSTLTAGNALTLTAVPSGITPASYQWRLNNIAIAGATAATYTVSSVSADSRPARTRRHRPRHRRSVVSRPASVAVDPAPTPPAAPASGGGGGGGSPSGWFLAALASLTVLRFVTRRDGK
ncbi:MAG: hypothetical protein QM760_06155 [Nibricoccus sp.]